ncbi:MAG: InlB B-repeat-containing protein, partial [Clostridia bacterium]|nr:InlB B-repeat-containing protein [Clostridia bacterium]
DELVQHIPAYLDKPVTAASAAIPAAFTLSTDVPRYTLETNYNSFRIESGDLYADVNNSTITGTLDIQFSDVLNEIGAPIELAYSLPILEDGAVYSVTPSADNNLDEYRTTFMYDDAADGFYLRADANACGTITLGTDTLLSTSFPETAEQEITVALNAWDAPWQSLVMNGSSTGCQVVSAEDGAQFTSDTPTTVSVSAEVFLDSVRFEEIELTSAGITVTESEDRVCSILRGEETVSNRNIGHYVIFDSRLGSNVDTVYDIPDDGLCEEPTEPTREGYLFTGWYTDLLFENKWDFAEDTVTDNMTLYAGWTRDPDYYCTVVFHFEDHAELLFVKRGEGLSEEALPDIPHKDGVIQKWDIDDLSSITEDMDVYIKISTIGDINGDNEVTPEDYNILSDYFSGQSADVTISSAAADLNDDSRVTRADAMILARYLAKWPGYAEKYFQ